MGVSVERHTAVSIGFLGAGNHSQCTLILSPRDRSMFVAIELGQRGWLCVSGDLGIGFARVLADSSGSAGAWQFGQASPPQQ